MADAIYKQWLDAVVIRIRQLTLSRIAENEIVLRKVPWDGGMLHRGITVSPMQEQIDGTGSDLSTNAKDMMGYPAAIVFVEGTGKGWGEDIDVVSMWRQQVRRAFHNKRIGNVEDTDTLRAVARVTHGGLFLPKEYTKNRDVSQMTVWGWYLEPRT